MKKIILVALLALGLASCAKVDDKDTERAPKLTTQIGYLFVQNVDGCEYVFNINGGVCHSSTCPNPIHREDMKDLAVGDTDDGV